MCISLLGTVPTFGMFGRVKAYILQIRITIVIIII